MQYIGMDVHKSFSYACVLDEKGNVLMEQHIPNQQQEMDAFIAKVEPGSKIVMESSSSWQYLYDYLDESGFDMTLAHPLKVKAIASARIKTDKIDAHTLAHLLRTDLIPESYVPPEHVRDERNVTRLRASLVEIRTQVKNKIHAILARHGIQYQFSDLFGKAGTEFLYTIELPEGSRFEVDQYLTLIAVLNERIDKVQEQIQTMSEDNYGAKLLSSIPGVGYYSALLIMAEISNIARFHSPKHLCGYAGLVPSVYQSGNTMRTGHITKQGSKWLRWVLIQISNRIVTYKNTPLAVFYTKIKERKGHNTAIVATARKLLIYIYTMLKHNIPYHALQINKGHTKDLP